MDGVASPSSGIAFICLSHDIDNVMPTCVPYKEFIIRVHYEVTSWLENQGTTYSCVSQMNFVVLRRKTYDVPLQAQDPIR